MSDGTVYEAIVRREDGGWDVEVPAADHSHTWAPNLRKARDCAAEIAAAWLELPLEGIQIELTVKELAAEIAAARAARRSAQLAASEAAATTRQVVAQLLELGLPERDVAVALGLSPQRVHQLRSA